jgi:tetratricopeptide (TPR) repeat protein
LLADAKRISRHPPYRDSTARTRLLAEQLAYRGHVREANRVIGAQDAGIAVELAYVGGVPIESLSIRVARLVADGSRSSTQALAWWAERRDTTALRTYATAARARLSATHVPVRLAAAYDTAAAQAHLALARGDSAGALARFTALPDTLCPRCYPDRLVRARLLSARGRLREALRDLREPLVAYLSPFELFYALERGRVAEQLGEMREAHESYAFVVASWERGDPEVQMLVRQARIGVTRVRGRQ